MGNGLLFSLVNFYNPHITLYRRHLGSLRLRGRQVVVNILRIGVQRGILCRLDHLKIHFLACHSTLDHFRVIRSVPLYVLLNEVVVTLLLEGEHRLFFN